VLLLPHVSRALGHLKSGLSHRPLTLYATLLLNTDLSVQNIAKQQTILICAQHQSF
jgi:hypothetical protein